VKGASWHLRRPRRRGPTCRGVPAGRHGRQRLLRLSTGRPAPVAALPCEALPVGIPSGSGTITELRLGDAAQCIRCRQAAVVTHVVMLWC